jgi:hypothetical protein
MKINLKILLLLCFCGGLVTPSVFGQKTARAKRVKRSKGLRVNFFDATVDSLETAIMSDGFVYGGANFTSNVNDLGRDNNVQQWALNPTLGFQRNNLDVYLNGFSWSKASPSKRTLASAKRGNSANQRASWGRTNTPLCITGATKTDLG